MYHTVLTLFLNEHKYLWYNLSNLISYWPHDLKSADNHHADVSVRLGFIDRIATINEKLYFKI